MIKVFIFLAATAIGYLVYDAWGALVGSILGMVFIVWLAAMLAEPKKEQYRKRPIPDFLVEDRHTIFASFIRKICQSFFSEKFWFTLLDAGQVVGNVLATIVISLLKTLGVLMEELLSFEEDSPFDAYNGNPLGQLFGKIDNSPQINIASGLPMIKDSCFDVAGNLYSTNSSWHI